MLRIEANRGTDGLTVTASGELTIEHLGELGRVIREAAEDRLVVALDLDAVTLADRESISFLANGEGRAARILRAPAYVREWIRLEETPSPERKGRSMKRINSLALVVIFVAAVAGMGCEHLSSARTDREATERLAKKDAPASLNPYGTN